MREIHSFRDVFDARPCGPRTYKPLRQRTRVRFAGDTKSPLRRAGVGEMESVKPESTSEPDKDDMVDRATLCLPHIGKDAVVHNGDEGFTDVLWQYFAPAESNATERLVQLKAKLKSASTFDFWRILMEDMCDVMGSQCAFVAKKMLVDDQDNAVEMPELGEPGSCLMGVAFYINNGVDVNELYRDYRYHAYGTPYAHMKYDKVFIVPERLTEFVHNKPNQMPWDKSEAFIGIPLFTEGKCFAHFGMIWSSEGASKRKLSWSFIEMFLHSLEDMILERILESRESTKGLASPESTPSKATPLSALTTSQSLKPYARSLSHELRTPMQGVVGMLDIMYSTVLDAIATQQSERARKIFNDLKGHIEVVQDSSRRAVEAADNVVHAYDLNLQMPETPLTPSDVDVRKGVETPRVASSRPQSPTLDIGVFPSPAGMKRDRTEDSDFLSGPPLKRVFTEADNDTCPTCYSTEISSSSRSPATAVTATVHQKSTPSEGSLDVKSERSKFFLSPVLMPTAILNPAYRQVATRDFMRDLVNEVLRNGHPTSQIHKETDLGETIEVRTLDSRGEIQDKTIYLEIEPDVPEYVITEEQHLQFALEKIVGNAVKFTEGGIITVTVKINRSTQVVEIWVVDTGCGIAEESKSNLFKPHFQEDASISRSKDGLGLGLFNAKAHVRKNLGGDVTLERSDTEGPSKGSEFLVRLPISTLDNINIDTPLVGTPPASMAQPCRPFFWSDSISAVISDSPITSRSPSRQSSPAQTSRKRGRFNPNLAMEYPLNILIAEDNAINRNVAVGSLNKLGYRVNKLTLAFDGLEAVAKYNASLSKPPSEHFDAVLMDIWMPNMDGYEATAKILELVKKHGQKTKVIAVTADITGDSLERAKAAGMQGFLAKPYKVLDLEQIIVENFQRCC